jgi:hypothetical protein
MTAFDRNYLKFGAKRGNPYRENTPIWLGGIAFLVGIAILVFSFESHYAITRNHIAQATASATSMPTGVPTGD